MSRAATYHTTVNWKGEHWGRIRLGNGPEMDFSAPPDAHGHAGVLTPEDAFVAAVNTCIMMMFIWTAERFKLDLVSYECRAEGTKLIELNRTESFTKILLRPNIAVRCEMSQKEITEKRVVRALETAQKYSLVANSVKSVVLVEPQINLHTS
jgi:organic hydroperoxide reductase OsmC/OhrA